MSNFISFGESEEQRPGRKLPISSYFSDGKRVIDFVLAFKPSKKGGTKAFKKAMFRTKFESTLKSEGLQLEYEGKEKSQDGKTSFVKIHATWEALTRQAEFEDLQMPIMESDVAGRPKGWSGKLFAKIFKTNPFELQEELKIPWKAHFTDSFTRQREEQFVVGDPETFFSAAQRAYLTWSIIQGVTISLQMKRKKKKKQEDDSDEVIPNIEVKSANILYMLSTGMYVAAFPLHDGEWKDDAENDYQGIPPNQWPMRKYLYEAWARPRQWYRHQPLDEIRNYYGEKVGLYFAWLGFYTKMLIIPSIIGVLTFLFGIIQTFAGAPFPQEFCNETMDQLNWTICRACAGEYCKFQKVDHLCTSSQMTAIFDNVGATFFSIFMAIWAIVFLEMWKRYQHEICARWDVSENEMTVEQVRPDYTLSVSTTHVNPVNKKMEPHLSKSQSKKRLTQSLLSVLFFIIVVIGLMVGVMIYKVVGNRMWAHALTKEGEVKPSMNPVIFTSLTASVANGLCIAVMAKIYMRVAWKLTMMELPRTERQFEDSYTYKVTIFQFVNFYGALFYLALGRGQMVFKSSPIDSEGGAGGCPVTGCLLDVTIQLFVIMTGKQVINNVLELGLPLLHNFLRRRGKSNVEDDYYARWEKDFDLASPPPINLFGDYLEMIIQFGFVTMFVPAFPLAPFFALLNNIIEIRLDAYKMITQTRRCIPVRAKDIGPWFSLLDAVSKVAIFTNAALIALTTNFLDISVYYMHELYTQTHESFLDFVLTKANTTKICEFWIKDNLLENINSTDGCMNDLMKFDNQTVETCYYRDYRNDITQERTAVWYHVLLAKLVFILVFEHVTFVVQSALAYLIPDVPDHVTMALQRESFLQRQAFKQHEYGDEHGMTEAIEEETNDGVEDDLDHKADDNNGPAFIHADSVTVHTDSVTVHTDSVTVHRDSVPTIENKVDYDSNDDTASHDKYTSFIHADKVMVHDNSLIGIDDSLVVNVDSVDIPEDSVANNDADVANGDYWVNDSFSDQSNVSTTGPDQLENQQNQEARRRTRKPAVYSGFKKLKIC